MKKAAIYSPYLDTLGGGERYVLSVAKILSETGYNVSVESDDPSILIKADSRFGLGLDAVNVVTSINRGDGYDLTFWLSDGSIPTLFSRKNILHFQRPFANVDGKSLINRMKLFRINHIIVNSQFTKEWIDREFPKESVVLYPPVDIAKFSPKKKNNLICYVGRFSQLEQSKRQDVLVDVFKNLHREGYRNWKLVLSGGVDVGVDDYLDKLKESAKGYNIEFVTNSDFKEITDLMGKSKFFWSASGFGVDRDNLPQKLEHFGMTVVEAMASGALPLVFNAGGHREIIESGENGYLWSEKEDLLIRTIGLIHNTDKYEKMIKSAQKSISKYSYENFKKEFLKLL